MEADDLLCSRNARSRTPLVGRAQWKINQPPSLKKKRASLEGACISFDARSRGQPDHSLQTGKTKKEGESTAWQFPVLAPNARHQKTLVEPSADRQEQPCIDLFPV
jgi:hypothetical protein